MPAPPSLTGLWPVPSAASKSPGSWPPPAMITASIYQSAFGRRSMSSPQRMTTNSVFRIASMTKAITAAAAMQMVEQGKLSLDQPAKEILPFLADTKVLLGFDSKDNPILRAPRDGDHAAQPADPYRRLRLRHLERGDAPVRQRSPACPAPAPASSPR